METYFDKVIDRNYAIDLMSCIGSEFLIDGNKLPTEFEFNKFLFERKKEILEITNRLNDRENVFYIEKLKMDLKGDYGGIEAYFFEQIELENILSVVPEVRELNTFTLNEEQFEQIEKKYSLFPYFKRAQNEILAFIEQFNIKAPFIPPQKTGNKSDNLRVPQIALIHVYEGKPITRENSGDIAAKHGYTSLKSGEGLFQDYTFYRSTANRKGKPTPCTPKKLENKIKLFESILIHLTDKAKNQAIDELQTLKTIYESEYQ